jgi:opacity protein-like surface antigen
MRRVLLAAILVVLGLLPRAAAAGDVTAFVAQPFPRDNWQHGYGAALSSTWFSMVSFEAEAARMPGATTDAFMTSFTASALVAPPVGFLTPYGGVGVGVFRQTAGSTSDNGTLRALVLGAKVKLGPLLVVKGEYRRLHLSGEPLLSLTHRISLGAGITF